MECPHCNKETLVKAGIRKTARGPAQKYRCTSCGRSSSLSDTKGFHYPLEVILHSLDLYNTGFPASSVIRTISKLYPTTPSERTIIDLSKRYSNDLTFIKLRKRYKIDPEKIVVTKIFNHRQVFPFGYHDLKPNIAAKKVPGDLVQVRYDKSETIGMISESGILF